MAITAQTLFNAQYAQSSVTSVYTVQAGQTVIIDKFTATNSNGGGSQTISINIVPSGQALGNSNAVVLGQSVALNATDDLSIMQNQILEPGDEIFVGASAANAIAIRASGRVIQ